MKSTFVSTNKINPIRIIVITLGVLIGISGVIHGLFEALQGYRSTDGFFIFAVGEGNDWTVWTQGSEGAFTLIQNFLVTGILAIIVGGILAMWSVLYIETKKGSLIFFLIGICLFIVGGGVAQVPFILLTAAVSSRIDKPPFRWRKKLSEKLSPLAKSWYLLLMGFLVLFATAFEISIFGFFPLVTEPNLLLLICWSTLGFATILLVLSIIGAFAYNTERNGNHPYPPFLIKNYGKTALANKRNSFKRHNFWTICAF